MADSATAAGRAQAVAATIERVRGIEAERGVSHAALEDAETALIPAVERDGCARFRLFPDTAP